MMSTTSIINYRSQKNVIVATATATIIFVESVVVAKRQ
jgi:hypothetical protein